MCVFVAPELASEYWEVEAAFQFQLWQESANVPT